MFKFEMVLSVPVGTVFRAKYASLGNDFHEFIKTDIEETQTDTTDQNPLTVAIHLKTGNVYYFPSHYQVQRAKNVEIISTYA